MSQVDGAFPRLNGAMLSSQDWGSSIVSLVGKAVAYDGQERVTFECADGVTVQLTVGGGEFDYVQGKPIEVMGAVSDDKSVQHFISRDLGDDFDFQNYNQLVSKVLKNPKYVDLFGQ